MSELRALICQKCGASLNPRTLRCEYCGTYHERIGDGIGVMLTQIERPEVRVLRCKLAVDNYLAMSGQVSDEQIGAYIRNGLIGRISEKLPEFMEIYSENDIINNRQMITGQIRVLEPKYRF